MEDERWVGAERNDFTWSERSGDEVYFWQRLIPRPALRDRPDLVALAVGRLVPAGPHRGDALPAGVVEGGAHVLEGLAPEGQVRQVDDGLLSDLEDRPPELARGEHRGLVDGVEGRHHPRLVSVVGEGLHRLGDPLGVRGGVAQGQGHAGAGAEGEARLPVRARPGLVAGSGPVNGWWYDEMGFGAEARSVLPDQIKSVKKSQVRIMS